MANVTDVTLWLMPNLHHAKHSATATHAPWLWGLEARPVRWRLYWTKLRRTARVHMAEPLDAIPPALTWRERCSVRRALREALTEATGLTVGRMPQDVLHV